MKLSLLYYNQNIECSEQHQSILKAAKEKSQVTYKDGTARIAAHLSIQTMKTRRDRTDVFPIAKDHNCQLNLIYPAKFPIMIVSTTKEKLSIIKAG